MIARPCEKLKILFSRPDLFSPRTILQLHGNAVRGSGSGTESGFVYVAAESQATLTCYSRPCCRTGFSPMRNLAIFALPCFVQLKATIDATMTNAPMYIPTGPVVSNSIANIEKTVPAAKSDMNTDFAMDLMSSSFRPRSHPGHHLREKGNLHPWILAVLRYFPVHLLEALLQLCSLLGFHRGCICRLKCLPCNFIKFIGQCSSSFFTIRFSPTSFFTHPKLRKVTSTFRLRPQNPNRDTLRVNQLR
jgi:hypothetical protein